MGIRTKIYITTAAWLVLCGVMFGWGLKILDASNRSALTKISDENSQLQISHAETSAEFGSMDSQLHT